MNEILHSMYHYILLTLPDFPSYFDGGRLTEKNIFNIFNKIFEKQKFNIYVIDVILIWRL